MKRRSSYAAIHVNFLSRLCSDNARFGGLTPPSTCLQGHTWDSHKTDEKSLGNPRAPEYTPTSASTKFLIALEMLISMIEIFQQFSGGSPNCTFITPYLSTPKYIFLAEVHAFIRASSVFNLSLALAHRLNLLE